jgi:8-amino-7-oxononanoate synthase
VLDFTSALYLGLRHATKSLRPWRELTEGRPAALGQSEAAATLSAGLADLVGCERATLSPSTLHLFWDIFGTPSLRGCPVFIDEGAYTISHWGAERALLRGSGLVRFHHHDPRALERSILQRGAGRQRPVIVCDGLCPACGSCAPLREYAAVARNFGGTLLIDDTQALGVLGGLEAGTGPYGSGGGGSLRNASLTGDRVLVISSLAKGLGVPVAMFGGTRDGVLQFERDSETRMHCSPPSAAVIHAALHALDFNRRYGSLLRRLLARLVRQFRDGLKSFGLASAGGMFPVQSPVLGTNSDTIAVHDRLLRLGVRTVLHSDRHRPAAGLSFLITARHCPQQIERAVQCLFRAVHPLRY